MNYDREIETIDGTIRLIERFDCDSGCSFYDCYLNDEYVCEAELYLSDSEIEDLVLL